MKTSAEQWASTRLVAHLWWCGDEDCDCTQPRIDRITPNRDTGYPWIRRETVWEGEFITDTYELTPDEREVRQLAPLREACERLGVPIPEDAEPG